MEDLNQLAIRRGIKIVSSGVWVLLGAVNPYTALGALTGVLVRLVSELELAYRNEYEENGDA